MSSKLSLVLERTVKNRFAEALILLLILLAIGYGISLTCFFRERTLFYILACLLAAAISVWVYVTIGLRAFRRKLECFFRSVSAGDYKVGIKMRGDEQEVWNQVAALANKTADQLGVYDELRKEKVSFNYRALELIFKNVSDRLILADIEEGFFKFNPPLQSFFGIEQEVFSIGSIAGQEINAGFMELFRKAVQHEKIVTEGRAVLQMPIRNSLRTVLVRIYPLKGKEEKVKLALLVLRESNRTAPSP